MYSAKATCRLEVNWKRYGDGAEWGMVCTTARVNIYVFSLALKVPILVGVHSHHDILYHKTAPHTRRTHCLPVM